MDLGDNMTGEEKNYVNKPFMLNLNNPEEAALYEYLGKLPARKFKHDTMEFWLRQMSKEMGGNPIMSHKEKIVNALSHAVLCDDCLSEETEIQPRQTINQYCRKSLTDIIERHKRKSCAVCKKDKIVNQLVTS
jgi:hypothetical protein